MNAALEFKTNFIKINEKHMKILYSHYDYKPITNINLKCAMHIGQVVFGYWYSPLRSQITALGMMLISVVDLKVSTIMIKLSFRKS
jgi:hypothetical protein